MSREGLWRLVQQRSELFERGLRVAAAGLELGSAGFGVVDGLLRDASGTAVLVFTTDDRDTALAARVLEAHAFWHRNAAGMPRALPEADLRDSVRCRLIVVATAMPHDVLATLERLQLPELEIIAVESFQVGGQERLVVRSLRGLLGLTSLPPIDASVAGPARELLTAFVELMMKLDPKIRVDGDRFARRAWFEAHSLGECWFAEDRLHGSVDGGPQRWLQTESDVRALGDLIARRYLAVLGQVGPAAPGSTPEVAAAGVRAATAGRGLAGARSGFEALRASVSAARLSREECNALGELGEVDDSEEETLAGG